MSKTDSKARKTSVSIYVIAGKEESLVAGECEKLVDGLLEPEQKTTGLFSADPAKVSLSEVLDELRTLPFLTDKRVVLIKNADKFISDNRESLEKYFDNPCPTGILLLTVSSWASNTKLAKKLPKVGKLISITQPKPWQLPGRLSEYATDAHDKKLSRNAAELLIELTGDNLSQLYSEIDKLALYADAEKSITTEHIESLIGHNRLFNAFTVIDAIVDGNAAKATNRLRNMFAEDKSAEYTVVGAFAFHFRRLFNAKDLLEKGLRPAEIAKQLRIWGNKDALFAQLRKMSLKQIGDNLQQLAATDYAIKTGRTKPQVAIEQLVLRLATG
ncbi:MAG: DNA polymerase III subunit delta [Planctomycetota bacterium]|jgi:DNA polymerase-3 subunit delta